MAVGSSTANIAMANLVMKAADGSGGVWQDPVQLIPEGMDGDPVGFIAKLKDGLPLVNTLRILFNEHSFNADGTLHPQMEAFLAAAVAGGYQLDMCYGEGDAQNIGIGEGRWPDLTNAQAFAALEANYADVAGAWTRMMNWMDGHAEVKAGVYGWEVMNESAAYRHSIRNNGAGEGLSEADFVKLYADHVIALSDLIQARAGGKVLVGGWGYNGDFLTLDDTDIHGESALAYLRQAVGNALLWSAHLYPGWMGTNLATSPAALIDRLNQTFAPVVGDDVLITEINAHGAVNDPTAAVDYGDFYAASYEWFAENGIGLGWYPAVQAGASHLLTLDWKGGLTYRHQHSLGHALNAFSLGQSSAADAGDQTLAVTLKTVRLGNESYEEAAGEPRFDAATTAGFAFGYTGNDTLRGTDQSNDFLYGGQGTDLLLGLAADDFLYGQSGDDALLGGAGTDNLFGGHGKDRLDGGAGRDFMAGGKQDDVYTVNAAGDHVREYLDEGNDTVMTGLASHALGAQVENLVATATVAFFGTGNALANQITGGAAADRLSGLAGNDSLNGGRGADVLIGGAGADVLTGGAGSDTASYRLAAGAVIADLTKITTVFAAGEARGDDLISVENLVGSAFADRLSGDAAANRLNGSGGDDRLAGRGGADVLMGGAGADRFVFAPGFEADRITDFRNDIDSIVLQGFGGVITATQALSHARQSGSDVILDFGQGDVLRIEATQLAALSNDLLILG
jgi:Ca2+-binding RTX toxin-like protein